MFCEWVSGIWLKIGPEKDVEYANWTGLFETGDTGLLFLEACKLERADPYEPATIRYAPDSESSPTLCARFHHRTTARSSMPMLKWLSPQCTAQCSQAS